MTKRRRRTTARAQRRQTKLQAQYETLAQWHQRFQQASGADDFRMAYHGCPAPWRRDDWLETFLFTVVGCDCAVQMRDWPAFVGSMAARNTAGLIVYADGRIRPSRNHSLAHDNPQSIPSILHDNAVDIWVADLYRRQYTTVHGQPPSETLAAFPQDSDQFRRASTTLRMLLTPGLPAALLSKRPGGVAAVDRYVRQSFSRQCPGQSLDDHQPLDGKESPCITG